jgi:hypothetical protein
MESRKRKSEKRGMNFRRNRKRKILTAERKVNERNLYKKEGDKERKRRERRKKERNVRNIWGARIP